ncbi:MAG: hypothetical protein NTZ74_16025 [Chloroflexi bacterium]|nr:hypothetical protein [Chloroflexota bacterium]
MRVIKFVIKSFFGGCFGCLGAFSLMAVFVLIIGLVFGPTLVNGVTSVLDSIPSILTQGMGLPFLGGGTNIGGNIGNQGTMTPKQPYSGAPMTVFLTMGGNPDGEHLVSFTREESKQVSFWVQSSGAPATQFDVLVTLPDSSQMQFGPTFTTDPSGIPVNCGRFGDATIQSGSYKLEAMPSGSSTAAGFVEFVITE